MPWEGGPQGAPLRLDYVGAHTGGRAPTRGAPTVGLCGRTHGGGEGTHEGCPYGWITGAHTGGGHPQGVPLRLDYVGPHTGEGRAPTRGAPTVGLCGPAHGGGEGTHEGCPYGWIMWARTRGRGGHPRGVPLRLDNGRTHGGRAPTRGAPTRFRQPHVFCPNLMQLPWKYAICGSRLICRTWSLRRIWREG